MAVNVDKIAGISIDVDDLIAVRARLEGLTRARNRRRVSSVVGAREIRLRGRGMEYAESRAYVYGDDMRTMDWRVMARTGEAYTKLFAEEKEPACLIAIDLSPSMFFGTRLAFKSWAAAQVAAHIGWLASLDGERIGGLVASAAHHAEIRPGKTRSGLLGIFHHLALADSQRQPGEAGASRLNFLCNELKRVAKPGADIALISDFLGLDQGSLQALANLTRHNQVHAYWINDASEMTEWPAGGYRLQNGPTQIYLDLEDSRHRSELSLQQLQHRERVESACASFNIPLQSISCNQEITHQLFQGLQASI